MGVLKAMTIISKIKAREARGFIEKLCEKYSFFLKYHLLHKENLIVYLLCHITYVTSFNKCSDPGVKLSDL